MKKTTAVIIINANIQKVFSNFFLFANQQKSVCQQGKKKLTGHDGLGFCAQTDK